MSTIIKSKVTACNRPNMCRWYKNTPHKSDTQNFCLKSNHFLRTLFQVIPKTFVNIGSGTSASSHVVDTAGSSSGQLTIPQHLVPKLKYMEAVLTVPQNVFIAKKGENTIFAIPHAYVTSFCISRKLGPRKS